MERVQSVSKPRPCEPRHHHEGLSHMLDEIDRDPLKLVEEYYAAGR